MRECRETVFHDLAAIEEPRRQNKLFKALSSILTDSAWGFSSKQAFRILSEPDKLFFDANLVALSEATVEKSKLIDIYVACKQSDSG